MKKTIVYIDGFNLFYGRLHHTDAVINEDRRKLRWLDLEKLISLHLPAGYEITTINFYTADIMASYIGDKGPILQQEYYKALGTSNKVRIIKGKFIRNPIKLPLDPIETYVGEDNKTKIRKVQVSKTEEKQSDVNFAAHLVRDSFAPREARNYYDLAVIVTNDSDLLEPIVIAKQMRKKILILCPHTHFCDTFRKHFKITELRRVQESHVKASQFPDKIIDAAGDVKAQRPLKWQ
jgi:hypothetical protein